MDRQRELVRDINTVAMKNLVDNRNIAPVAFIVRDGLIRIPVLMEFNTDQEKYENCNFVGAVAKYYNADVVILVHDSALREYDNEKNENYAMSNFSTENPLAYPDSMRKDGISLLVIDIKTRETLFYLQQYEERGEKGYRFTELKEMGKIGGEIPEKVLEGYDSSIDEKEFEALIEKDSNGKFKLS